MDGMIDVKSRRCAAEACNKYPAFNMPGENTARFCGDHRQPGMIDVHNKRCAFEGCQKRPTFNYVGKLDVSVHVHTIRLEMGISAAVGANLELYSFAKLPEGCGRTYLVPKAHSE